MRKKSTLVVLGLIALGGAARAENAPPAGAAVAPAPAPPAESVASTSAGAPEPARHRKLQVGASFLPMALGKYIYSDTFTTTATQEAFFAYGVGLSGSYEVLPGLLVGLAPQVIFNVQPKPSDAPYSPAAKELDLMLRVAYAYPVLDTVSIYAEALPGFSDIIASNDASPSRGFVLGLGVGCTADMTDRFFINVGGGYQLGFQNQSEGIHTLQLRTRYVRVALGGGFRF